MNAIDDDQLRAHFRRRSDVGSPAGEAAREERLRRIVMERVAVEPQRRILWRPTFAGIGSDRRATAAVSSLVVAAVLASIAILASSGTGPQRTGPTSSAPFSQGSPPPATPPVVRATGVQVLTESQLEEVVSTSANVGRVVVADVQITSNGNPCAPVPCSPEYAILGEHHAIGVDAGQLDASSVRAPLALRIVAPWAVQLIAQVGSPSSSGVSLTLPEYRAEILNQRLQPAPEGTVPIALVVDAWLETQVGTRACPAEFSIPPRLSDFTCGGWSWLTPSAFVWTGEVFAPPPGGLLVQNLAYADFASNPVVQDSPPLSEPRRGLYLIAPAHTEGGTCSIDCEVPDAASVLARIDPITLTPSPAPTALSSHAETALGDFKLTFDVPKTRWTSSESITGTSRLEYLGSGPSALSGSIGGPLGFELNEVNGTRNLAPVYDDACAFKAIDKGFAVTAALRKDGGYDADLPSASFYASFFADPLYRLPPGDWEISAWGDFESDPHGCSGPEYKLKATIRVHVTP